MRLVFDVEATGSQRNKANPYDPRNVACNLGIKNLDTGESWIYKIQYDEEPYGKNLKEIQTHLDTATELIGFNLKYDLSWLYRYNLSIPDGKRCKVFDCQVAHFILNHQLDKYPSLDGCAEIYKVVKKIDIVKTEYWDKGLDTNEVPYEILSEYLQQDLEVTEAVYHAIKALIPVSKEAIIKMAMLDLLVLFDMETNGIKIDVDTSQKLATENLQKLENIDNWFKRVTKFDWFNPSSGDHVSAFLYGGTLKVKEKEDYEFTYVDGRKAMKTRSVLKPYTFRQLFKPLPKTELAKEGFYATNEATLTSLLKKAKGEFEKVLSLILKRAKIKKLVTTYYVGYLKKMEANNWQDNLIHTSFNQCVARSGRLSSTGPNIQNIAGEVQRIVVSRFRRSNEVRET